MKFYKHQSEFYPGQVVKFADDIECWVDALVFQNGNDYPHCRILYWLNGELCSVTLLEYQLTRVG